MKDSKKKEKKSLANKMKRWLLKNNFVVYLIKTKQNSL